MTNLSKPKIRRRLVIGCSSPPDTGSGISTYSKEISIAFSKAGFEVVYVSPSPQDFSWIRENSLIHWATEPASDQKKTTTEILQLLKAAPVLSIINNDNPVLQGLAPFVDCSFLCVAHLDAYAIASLASLNSQWCDYTIAISHDMQKHFVNHKNLPLTSVPIIHNGIGEGKPDLKPAGSKSTAPLKVICASEYSKRKGGDKIYLLCKKICSTSAQMQVEWYADIPSRQKTILERNNNIRIKGRVERSVLLESLRGADVLLFASRREGCPMLVLEALSCGILPILSDGIGAMRWMINPGIEGYICSIRHWPTEALNCLQELERNRTKLASMRQAALDRYRREFKIDRVVRDFLTLIETPRVQRATKPSEIRIPAWHRYDPIRYPASLSDRILWRIGKLKYVGTIRET